jgi:hypothetical protein
VCHCVVPCVTLCFLPHPPPFLPPTLLITLSLSPWLRVVAGHPKALFVTYSAIMFLPMVPNLVMALYYVLKRASRTCLLLFCRVDIEHRMDDIKHVAEMGSPSGSVSIVSTPAGTAPHTPAGGMRQPVF